MYTKLMKNPSSAHHRPSTYSESRKWLVGNLADNLIPKPPCRYNCHFQMNDVWYARSALVDVFSKSRIG